VCRTVATLSGEISASVSATIENNTIFVTTHCKKLTIGNNLFITRDSRMLRAF